MYVLVATVVPTDKLDLFRWLAEQLDDDAFYIATQGIVMSQFAKIEVEEVAAARAIADQYLEQVRENLRTIGQGRGILAVANMSSAETGEKVSEWFFPADILREAS